MNSNQKFLAGILLGAAAGVALTIFFKSEKGQEVLDNLQDAASDAGEKLKSKMSNVNDDVSGLIQKGKKFVQELTSKAQSETSAQ
jgi:gas vesicle protein